MFKKKKHSKLLDVFKKMPKLFHTMPGEKFNNGKSEVNAWLKEQDALLAWLFEKGKNLGYVKYNDITGEWMGIDYIEPCGHGYEDWDECPVCRL